MLRKGNEDYFSPFSYQHHVTNLLSYLKLLVISHLFFFFCVLASLAFFLFLALSALSPSATAEDFAAEAKTKNFVNLFSGTGTVKVPGINNYHS